MVNGGILCQYFSVGNIMIRNIKHHSTKSQQNQQVGLINYRNALYQGQINRQNQQRQGKGLIYQSSTHHFIACNNFHANKVSEEVLFYHSHAHYHYGRWKNNAPHGVCVFRFNQILIITEYEHGKIKLGANVLFIFQKYCTGMIIQVQETDRWTIRSKSEVFLNEQIQSMIKQCDFADRRIVSTSLIKFLNKEFSENAQNSIKFRLINNQYYRFGFDKGLAISFNDDFQISSIGFHNKNDLQNQIGIKFYQKESGEIIQEGIFDGSSSYVFQKDKKPQVKLGQLYLRHHLSSIDFINQFYIDPSQQYINYFHNLMKQKLFKDMVNQLINTNSNNIELSKDENIHEDISIRYKKLQFEYLQAPSLKKAYIESLKSERMKQFFEEQSSIKLFDKFEDKDYYYHQQPNSFDRLSEADRLYIMKKQLKNSLAQKQILAKLGTDRSKKSFQCEEKLPSKRSIKQREQIKKGERMEDQKISENRSQQSRKANLQQKIDIIIRQPPPEDNLIFKSRSKKKIFELSKSIKRDYSPQVQPSPFKSRMKARIFDISYDRTPSRSKSKSRSSKKIFGKLQKSSYSKTQRKIKPNEQQLSPHLQLGFSIDKSSGSSQIANFPVTMTKQNRIDNPKESQGVEDEGQINTRSFKQNQGKINLKQNFKMKEDDMSHHKKGNQIYRNQVNNGNYNQYVYEPITIKQAGNTPYLKNSSLKSLSKNKSNTQLLDKPNIHTMSSKKIIQESSPFNNAKMSAYLNQQKEYRPNTKYSDYKKRTGYF